MSTQLSRERRTVRYESLDDLLADAEQLAATPHETLGNWSYGQILWHISQTMHASIDGYSFQLPWVVRKCVIPFLRKSLLTKPLKPGFKAPKKAAPIMPSDEVPVDRGLEDLRAAIARIGRETPTARHPVFDAMTPEEWTLLHLRHAELHMSFVQPVDA